jgi:1-aminocyclopropane-1-carboxylate deaminase/D-cysteine desulfhydrase-like pyridoxal-dependent ACC family enzyme
MNILNIDKTIIMDESLNASLCGGNKIRKLKYILQGKDDYPGYMTIGSKYSSHCLAVAFLGHQKSKKVRLLITEEYIEEIFKYPHLKLAKEFGAEIIFIGTSDLFNRIEIEQQDNKSLYWIAGGGHTLEGLNAYKDWFKDLVKKNTYIADYKHIILPFGTGTTALGIVSAIYELNLNIKVYGISVARSKDKCLSESLKMVDEEALSILVISDEYAGKYGVISKKQEQIRLNFLKEYGIYPDPIYNVRVAQYLDENPLNSCIIINTGGHLNNLLNIDYNTKE